MNREPLSRNEGVFLILASVVNQSLYFPALGFTGVYERCPDLNGENNRRNKPFTIINAQLTKYFRWGSIYGGSENLTGFRQKDPISGAYEPWGNDFDATMVWGPVHGRKLYLGLRYAIKYEQN